jgi:acetylornithine deacetylase/succinyl-diaminopimelate desuccinylase-like protein
MSAIDILDRLIAFPSVVATPNGEIVGWIRDYLEPHGATVSVLKGPEGDRANLFATIGPVDIPGYILSGHMDVVPAREPDWSSDPFALRRDGERLYGRGTTDMKGFLAAALAAVPALAKMSLRARSISPFPMTKRQAAAARRICWPNCRSFVRRRSGQSSASRAICRRCWHIRARLQRA